MAMDLRDPNVWISHLLENLPEEKLASALKDDNPDWEYIDGEIVKLGSLAHAQLDIPELQRRGYSFWLLKAKTSGYWHTCSEPCNMPVIHCWHCTC